MKQTNKKILSELCSSDPCVFYQGLEKVKSCWSMKMKMIMKNLLFCFLSFWLLFLIYFSCCSWLLFREQNKITAVMRFITLESIIQDISKPPPYSWNAEHTTLVRQWKHSKHKGWKGSDVVGCTWNEPNNPCPFCLYCRPEMTHSQNKNMVFD